MPEASKQQPPHKSRSKPTASTCQEKSKLRRSVLKRPEWDSHTALQFSFLELVAFSSFVTMEVQSVAVPEAKFARPSFVPVSSSLILHRS